MDLKWGSKIPGSKLIRAFCSSCGTPMRVSPGTIYPSLVVCEQCRSKRSKSRATGAHKTLGKDDSTPELKEP